MRTGLHYKLFGTNTAALLYPTSGIRYRAQALYTLQISIVSDQRISPAAERGVARLWRLQVAAWAWGRWRRVVGWRATAQVGGIVWAIVRGRAQADTMRRIGQREARGHEPP